MATVTSETLYTDGRYVEASGGNWHLEDSPFKADCIDRMVRRHRLQPQSVCEIGCGAGGILADLRNRWDNSTQFTGYEISPQAHGLSQKFAAENLRFVLGDAFADQQLYDLVLVMDVVEHVENCFEFMRMVQEKGKYKLYHFPLEINCSTALRDMLHRGYQQGHIHHFSRSTVLAALQHTGHEIIDAVYTPVAFAQPRLVRTHLANIVRRVLPTGLCTRLLGGYSLLVLTR